MLNQHFDDYTATAYCFAAAGTHLQITIHNFKFA
jgi:hypothetical protein